MIFVAAAFAASTAAGAADDAVSPPTTSKAAPQAGAKEGAKEPAPPPSVTVIGARDAHGILGREVRSAANENMGRIVDVIQEVAEVHRQSLVS
jgi:hypothetical protein